MLERNPYLLSTWHKLCSTITAASLQQLKICHHITRTTKQCLFSLKTVSVLWRRGEVVVTTAQLNSIKSELRFCAGSNLARSVWEIRDVEDL